ncbi:hypothetical protein ACVWWW_001795 [Lysobacter sp. HA18]
MSTAARGERGVFRYRTGGCSIDAGTATKGGIEEADVRDLLHTSALDVGGTKRRGDPRYRR